MSATHRYLVTDLVTDTPLGWIPLSGVTYSRRVNAQGDLTGRFPVNNARLGELARLMVDRPVGLYAERRDVHPLLGATTTLWWGGIVWGALPSTSRRGQAPGCDITAATFDSLPNYRRILSDFDIPTLSEVLATVLEVDRGEAIARLWDRMQASGPTAGAGIDVGTPHVGGDPGSWSWLGSAATPYAEAISQIASVEPAVEWTIDVWADDDGTRNRRLRVGTPILGDQTLDPLLVATPSTVVGLGQLADNTTRATHAVARGVGSLSDLGADVQPITTPVVVDEDAYQLGAPRIDAVIDVPTDDDARLLTAAEGLLRPRNPIPSIQVTLPPGHPFQPGVLGQQGRVRVDGWLFDGGRLDTTRRIIGVQVQPAERGRPELVTFEFQDDSGVAQTGGGES